MLYISKVCYPGGRAFRIRKVALGDLLQMQHMSLLKAILCIPVTANKALQDGMAKFN